MTDLSELAVRIERLTTAHADAFAILEEYYEAVHVMQRDDPASIRNLIHEPGSGMWLAYVGDEVQGCVVLRRLASEARASECKRLYVKPRRAATTLPKSFSMPRKSSPAIAGGMDLPR